MDENKIIIYGTGLLVVLKVIQIWLKPIFSHHHLDRNATVLGFGRFQPEYKGFVKVSNHHSPINGTRRSDGDYFDYVFPTVEDKKSECMIESKLMRVYGVDLYE